MTSSNSYVAIINHGMGNLFSIENACKRKNISYKLTSDPKEVEKASGVILPGVGAFSDAMQKLEQDDLIVPLRDYIQADHPFLGICLGMQLLMRESEEFGSHRGLNVFAGQVKRFTCKEMKVPQVGWNLIDAAGSSAPLLEGLDLPEYMYFMHSFYVAPESSEFTATTTTYGEQTFCSSMQKGNLFACQFHPERSGENGLQIFNNFKQACQIEQWQTVPSAEETPSLSTHTIATTQQVLV